MGNATRGFLLALFNTFIVYIVFANFLGWSGGAINVTGYQGIDWSNTYIGFESLINMVADFEKTVGDFNMTKFVDAVEDLTNAILIGIPKFIVSMQNGGNPLDILNLVFTIFFQPFLLIGYIFMCIFYLLVWIVAFLVTFVKLCGGAYNIPFEDTSDIWNQWSFLSSEWDWSNIPSSVLIPRAL